jgi:hypothetical protein
MRNTIVCSILAGCLIAVAGMNTRAQSSDDLSRLPYIKAYTIERISSYDRAGANDDGGRKNPIKPGETRTIGDAQGPGIITHMWFTIDAPENYNQKQIVFRKYWDG